MIGGGCTFLKLAQKVDDIKATLENDEQRVRAPCPRFCFFIILAAEAVHLSITKEQTSLLHSVVTVWMVPARRLSCRPCMHQMCGMTAYCFSVSGLRHVALDWMLCHGGAKSACAATTTSYAQVGAEIVRKALSYPLRLIANNAGVNGSVVQQRVLENLDQSIGYNAATDKYEDLMAAGIIDPTKVRGCQNINT